jgi:adhesin transport system outer membrane protein
METAVEAAIQVHPSIQVARSDVLAASANIDVARAAYYPSISAGMGSGDASSESGIRWRPQMQLSVSQMVYDFGKTDATVRSRIASREASDFELVAARESVARDTIEAFAEVQRYSALDQAAQAQADGIGKIAALVADRSQSGASSRSDEQQAIARVQAAKTNRLELNSQLQRWRAVLGQYIGQSVPSRLGGSSSAIDRGCDGGDIQTDQASTILLAEAKQREAIAELARERASSYPTIALDGGASYAFAGNVNNDDRTFYRLGLNVKTDVFNGGASKAALAAASYSAEGAKAGVELARFEVTNAVNTAKAQVSNVRQMVSLLNERDAVLKDTRDLYREQYVELGTRTLLDLLNAEQEVHQAAFDKINSAYDLRKLGLACLYSSGALRQKFNIGDLAPPKQTEPIREKVAKL